MPETISQYRPLLQQILTRDKGENEECQQPPEATNVVKALFAYCQKDRPLGIKKTGHVKSER
jgi:hypothetical protein